MDKDEILSFDKKEDNNNIDKTSSEVKNRGLNYGVNIVYLLYILYSIIALIKNQMLSFVAQSIFMALITGNALSRWQDNHKKSSLFILILGIIATITTTVAAVIQLLGLL